VDDPARMKCMSEKRMVYSSLLDVGEEDLTTVYALKWEVL